MTERQITHDGTIEGRVTALEIRMAVTESNVQEINKKLDNINTNINKLTWIVVGAVVLAILRVIFKGGV